MLQRRRTCLGSPSRVRTKNDNNNDNSSSATTAYVKNHINGMHENLVKQGRVPMEEPGGCESVGAIHLEGVFRQGSSERSAAGRDGAGQIPQVTCRIVLLG